MIFKEKVKTLLQSTSVGERTLNYVIKKRREKRLINEYVCVLKDTKSFYIYGFDEESIKIDKELKKIIGIGCRQFIVKEITELLEKQVLISDLNGLDDFNTLKIVLPPRKMIISDLEMLLGFGLRWDQIVMGEGWQTYLGGKVFNAYDSMLGYTRIDDLPGFTIFEPDKVLRDKCYTVVVLGNSTADPYTSNIKSWPQQLYDQLIEQGINVRVICGALNSYHSRQEMLKLLRDILPMNPDIVISYSGINDTKYFQKRHVCEEHPDFMLHQEKFIKFAMDKSNKEGFFRGNVYHDSIKTWTFGIPNEACLSQRWVNNERIMYALCNEFGIDFIGILQPCRDYGGYIKTGEPEKYSYSKSIEENKNDIKQFYNEVRNLTNHLDYIVDMSEFFKGRKCVFYDYCHVFESGNREIATYIAGLILARRHKGRDDLS